MEQKVTIAAQHWRNSMQAALEDAEANPEIRLRHWTFEGMLSEPERILSEICAFIELDWRPEICRRRGTPSPGARATMRLTNASGIHCGRM